jgi:GT2 family glycosyltransferase
VDLGRAAAVFDAPEPVFGACGAAVLYRRRMLDEIGFLDEDFFLYNEDTDLNFRARLAGWKCIYVASAIAYHLANATSRLSDLHVYYHKWEQEGKVENDPSRDQRIFYSL